ncbi:hypothetical protein Tco_1416326 [Tanacetum coccineum]
MANLKFTDTYNLVAFLSKPEESDGFKQIVDFLNANPIKHALTVNPIIYTSCNKQFWATIKVKTVNGEVQLHALVDGKKIIINESTVRRDLQLEDAEGIDCLPNSTIFEQLALMGKPKRKDTQVPQPSGPTDIVADEAVHKELGDSLVRAATTASSLESDLKRKVKKLEQKKRSRTHGLKRLHKVGISRRVESSGDEDSLDDVEMFDVNTLTGDEVVAEQEVAAKDVNLTIDEVTLAQALAALKSVKPKVKGIVIQDPSTITTTTISSQQPSHDKGKGIMVEEPVKTMKKKDLIRLDEEIAKRLQVEFDEEERLPREKDEFNVSLIEEWDDIQAKIKADHKLAQRLQAEEQEELSVKEKEKLFQQLLEQRRKHFAAKSAKEKRNKPPTQAQQRKIMCTYLKNMEGNKPKDLKNKSFDSI